MKVTPVTLVARGRDAVARVSGRLGLVGSALIAGLVLRFAFAPFTAWPHDDVVWFQAASAGQHQVGLYSLAEFPYPPLWGVLLEGLGQVLAHIGILGTGLGSADPAFAFLNQSTHGYANVITSPAFNVAFKSVLFAFDVGVAVMLRGLVTSVTGDKRRGDIAFVAWFLNPLVIFETAVFGSFDVLVGFFCLAAIVLALHRRYLWAGLAVGLGVFTKVSPIFLVPLIGLVAADPLLQQWRLQIAWRPAAAFAGGLLISCIIVAVPALLSGDASSALHGTTSRASTTLNVGGLSIFGLTSFRFMSWLGPWAGEHGTAITNVTTLIAVAGSCLVGVAAMRWTRRDRAQGLLGGAVIALAVVLLTQPVTQPQYVMWLLPIATAFAVISARSRWPLVVVSLTPLVYVYSLFGPAAVLAPLSRATGWISSQTIVDRSLAWYNQQSNLWATDLGSDYRAVASLLSIVALAALIVGVVRGAPREPARLLQRRTGPTHRPRAALAMTAAVALVTAVATGPADRVVLASDPASLDVSGAHAVPGGVSMRVAMHGGPGQTTMRLVAIPVAKITPTRTIDVLVDSTLPGPDSDLRTVQGVFDHLSTRLAALGYMRPVEEIQVPALVSILADVASAPSRTVVMTAGVMPAAVFSRHTDLISPWIRAGGMLVWSGDALGYYSEGPTATFDPADQSGLHNDGPPQIVGDGVVEPGVSPGRTAQDPTPTAAALGLREQSTAIGVNLLAPGIRALGYTGDGLSSITDVSVGAGDVLILATDTYDEESIADDMSRILLSDILDGRSEIASLDVSASATIVDWTAPVTLRPTESLLVQAFDPDLEGVVYIRRVVTA